MTRLYGVLLLLVFLCFVNGHRSRNSARRKSQNRPSRAVTKLGRGLLVNIERIRERNEQGRIIGTRGNADERHSFLQIQRPLEFSFSEVANVEVQNVSALTVNFTARFPAPNGTLNVMLFRFLEAGNVTIGNETFEVRRGSLAFNVEILDWKFCNGSDVPCRGFSRNQNGTSLEVRIILAQFTGRRRSRTGCPRVVLPNVINVDGEEQPGAAGRLFRGRFVCALLVRFPLFNSSVSYGL